MIYKTKGTCTREIELEVEDGKVAYVNFIGGCDGNTKGLSRLVEGMEVDEVIHRLSGTSGILNNSSKEIRNVNSCGPDHLRHQGGAGHSRNVVDFEEVKAVFATDVVDSHDTLATKQ